MILWLLIPDWRELAINPETGKMSQKNLFQLLYGVGGMIAAGVAVWADVDKGRQVNSLLILFLLLAGLTLVTAKIVQLYLNRKTTDEDGPLAKPKPQTDEELMPRPDTTPPLGPLAGTDYPSTPPNGKAY